MSRSVVFRDAAREEFDAAFDWYDAQRPDLALAFLSEIERTINAIATRPTAYRIIFGEVRRAIVRRFPYAVFYILESHRIEIIAVYHSSRDPADWQKRTTN